MSRFLAQLFGLDRLTPGQHGVRFNLVHAIPAWGWVFIVLAALVLAIWSYRRLEGRTQSRMILAGIRAALLILLVFLAAGPELIRDNQRIERDTVIVLLDRSASLMIPDGSQRQDSPDRQKPITRDAQLRRIVRDPIWQTLRTQHDIRWMGFDASAYEIAKPIQTAAMPDDVQPNRLEIPPALGVRTRLGQALAQALEQNASRPIAGVVLVTDGRTSNPPDNRLLRALQARKVGVVCVPLGSEQPLFDLALSSVDAPTAAFVNDYVPVTATITLHGDAVTLPRATVLLEDTITGKTLDSKQIEPQAWHDHTAKVQLSTQPSDAGAVHWRVRVQSDGEDILSHNNELAVEMTLADRPLRVAYFEGYPRWEYRFLKDMLVLEDSVRSSVLMLATNRRYIQEGDVGLGHVPRTEREWADIDVVILGDLRPDVMSAEQLTELRNHVGQRGGGLVWIAGPGSTPWDWIDSPMADLLPFTALSVDGQPGIEIFTHPATLRREPASNRLGVLNMGDTPAQGWLDRLSDPQVGWSALRWSVGIEPNALKPTAQVLATVTDASIGKTLPCVLTMRYGAGRVVFVGTDEIWRWRYARGSTLGERFYLPLLRLAGRGSLSRSGQAILLSAEPTTVEVNRPVRIGAVLLDQSLVDASPPTLGVKITTTPGSSTKDNLQAAPEGDHAREQSTLVLGQEGSGSQAARYAASWVPSKPGRYRVHLSDPLFANFDIQAAFRVVSPDDEMRMPDADHALLAKLAEQTGSVVLSPTDLRSLAAHLPNRSIVIEGQPDIETLWDSPPVLALLLVLLSVEWMGRRFIRLA